MKTKIDALAIIMGLLFAIIWSSAFTSARIIVTQAPALGASALRFFIAGLIGIGLAYILGQRMRFTAPQWRAIFIFGLCQNAIYLGLFFTAMQRIDASLAAIIASTMPLIVGLFSSLILGEKLSAIGWVGLFMGFTGAALILVMRFQGNVDLLGVFLCIVGVLALATATLILKNTQSGQNILMAIGLQMLVGSAVLAPISWLTEMWSFTLTPSLFWAFSYTVLFPGLVATYIWFTLVRRIGATHAATFHFFNPFFGVVIASLFLGEAITLMDFMGIFVIMAGIFIVQRTRIVAVK